MTPDIELLQNALTESESLIALAARLGSTPNTEDLGEAETRRRLNEHGVSDEEIARQLSTLGSNTAPDKLAPIVTYSYLHGLQHLDGILSASPRLSRHAESTLALFRCVELCLFTLGRLATTMGGHIDAGRLGAALSDAHWRTGFNGLLYRTSLLVAELGSGREDDPHLDIRRSETYRAYRAQTDALHLCLMHRWREDAVDVFAKDLDDPRRRIFFDEFVNTSDENVWTANLSSVCVAGASLEPGEDLSAFYERMVRSAGLREMATAMETREDSDLLSFRVIHQVVEVVANQVNRDLCATVEAMLRSPSEALAETIDVFAASNRLLSVVDEAMRVMMRSLTPHAYSAVRPNLGMVRGTSSVVLRKTLFNSTYPLLVRAFKLRLAGGSPELAGDDELMRERTAALAPGSLESALARQLIVLHQHIRTWRDNHQQLPKTHLGSSPVDGQPTVSLSGSASAVEIAHELRKTHGRDPISPLYQGVLGRTPAPVHDLLKPGGFDEFMAHATGRAALDAYAGIQERFYRRCPVMHQRGGAGHDE
jgi:hypothetical protein